MGACGCGRAANSSLSCHWQWFERARFEWHPNNPESHRVLLGLLGTEVRQATAALPAPAATSAVRGDRSVTSLALALPERSTSLPMGASHPVPSGAHLSTLPNTAR
ncbi:MAG: hypothetical protein IT340_01155 [Chloroflexi bacterium]|nr:hypothetical protein [Chloroflexota bacterium]